MRNVSVARRYARALLELAAEDGSTDAVGTALQSVATAMDSSEELRDVFVNPTYTGAQRALVLDQLLAAVGDKAPPLANALKLLNERHRLAQLPTIARLYSDMADDRAGRLRGQVTSAVKLPKDELDRLAKTLEKITSRSVLLDAKVDPSVIGGVSAQVGSRVFDGTLRGQLEDLRRQLKGA
jgi:F-type H+-transporting ATPase subunit delta